MVLEPAEKFDLRLTSAQQVLVARVSKALGKKTRTWAREALVKAAQAAEVEVKRLEAEKARRTAEKQARWK